MGFGVWGLAFRGSGLGCGVWGLGFRGWVLRSNGGVGVFVAAASLWLWEHVFEGSVAVPFAGALALAVFWKLGLSQNSGTYLGEGGGPCKQVFPDRGKQPY